MRIRKTTNRDGFTLVELLVVVAIIGVLIGVLLPAFSAMRDQAKVLDCKARLEAIDTGLEMFRAEAALGSAYPPSSSDHPTDHQAIRYPRSTDAAADDDTIKVAGAHLLYQALAGADDLGTPGFRDGDGDGRWWDDTHAGPGGAYEVNRDTGVAGRPRYGTAGFVDEKMRTKGRSTLTDIYNRGGVSWGLDANSRPRVGEQPLFVDPWENPILYYRANKAATLMLGKAGRGGGSGAAAPQPGIYRQEDNGVITGSTADGYQSKGIDFGAGMADPGSSIAHYITVAAYPNAVYDGTGDNPILTRDEYDFSLARFIFDENVRSRNTPVRRDTFLLISAGKDQWYGTADDVVNWTKGN